MIISVKYRLRKLTGGKINKKLGKHYFDKFIYL